MLPLIGVDCVVSGLRNAMKGRNRTVFNFEGKTET